MRYIFNETKTAEVKEDELLVTFVDFTGQQQTAVASVNESLHGLPILEGTCQVISM